MTDIKTVDYQCAECGAQAVMYKARVYVNHKDTCDLLAWMDDNHPDLTIHLMRGGEDEHRSGPWHDLNNKQPRAVTHPHQPGAYRNRSPAMTNVLLTTPLIGAAIGILWITWKTRHQ